MDVICADLKTALAIFFLLALDVIVVVVENSPSDANMMEVVVSI